MTHKLTHLSSKPLLGIVMTGVLAAIVMVSPLLAQTSSESPLRIVSGEDVRVSTSPLIVHIEPHLAVHPEDPTQFVAAAMTLSKGFVAQRVVFRGIQQTMGHLNPYERG